jgi:hypothetical protein
VNSRWLDRTLWMSVIAVGALSLFLTARQFVYMRAASGRLARKVEELGRLLVLQDELQRDEAARKRYEAIETGQPASLGGPLKEVVSEPEKLDIRDTVREAVPGWVVRQKEITFGDVPLGKAMEFVRTVEAQRPPWRLTKCVIRASSHTEGVAQTVLVLDALERRK